MSVRSGTGIQVCVMPNLCVALPLSLLLQLRTSPDLGSRPFFLLLEFRTTGRMGEGEREGRERAPGGSAPHGPRQVPTLTGSQSLNFVLPLGTSLCCYEDQRERWMCKVEHPVLEFCSFNILSTRVVGGEPEGAAPAWSWQSTRVKSTDSAARLFALNPAQPSCCVTPSRLLHLSLTALSLK